MRWRTLIAREDTRIPIIAAIGSLGVLQLLRHTLWSTRRCLIVWSPCLEMFRGWNVSWEDWNFFSETFGEARFYSMYHTALSLGSMPTVLWLTNCPSRSFIHDPWTHYKPILWNQVSYLFKSFHDEFSWTCHCELHLSQGDKCPTTCCSFCFNDSSLSTVQRL